jgi:hypothetical protein
MPTNTTNLVNMLRTCRPANSKWERRFKRHFLSPLGVQQDECGNIFKRIGDAPIMWSSHTDTVHRLQGMQQVEVDGPWARLPDKSKSNCLGADDTAGVWLMSEMIKANRPGLYVFHYGEERGGIGSNYIANKNKKFLDGIKCAIALDRRGYDDVITHQFGRCCSDTFATALANKLGDFKPSPHGVFTDTANYVDDIPECTNLSVGYFNQHCKDECLNLEFISELRDKLCDLDFSDLPIERDPNDKKYDIGYGGTPWEWNYDGVYSTYRPARVVSNEDKVVRYLTTSKTYGAYLERYHNKPTWELIADHPRELAEILQKEGVTHDDLMQMLYEYGLN